jgi:hypothetical protein
MKLYIKLVFTFLALVFAFSLNAQLRRIKPVKTYPKTTNFSFGAGLTRSVLFLSRNVKENNDASGINLNLIYGGAKLLRVSIEYSYFSPINIEPTWTNIHANSIEANAHVIARFKNTKAFFYPLFGLSYNHFSGFFTGKNDFLNVGVKYKANTSVTNNWLGLNVGTGYEQFFGQMSVFIDYKMRVGIDDGKSKQINIMDVCISAGLRYNIKVPSVYKLFSGTKGRYFLDTD